MVGFDDTLLPDSVAVVLARPCDICGKQLKICSSSLRYSFRKLMGAQEVKWSSSTMPGDHPARTRQMLLNQTHKTTMDKG